MTWCREVIACMCRVRRKEVSGLAVHPSGLLALSTARDDVLRMWNMTKGRSQYKTKIAPGTEAVEFSPSGSTYALLSSAQVRGLSPEMALVLFVTTATGLPIVRVLALLLQ